MKSFFKNVINTTKFSFPHLACRTLYLTLFFKDSYGYDFFFLKNLLSSGKMDLRSVGHKLRRQHRVEANRL